MVGEYIFKNSDRAKKSVLTRLISFFAAFVLSAVFTLTVTEIAFADGLQRSVSELADNVVKNTNRLPAFIAAIAYLIGLFLGVNGILKLRDHVENPSQAPLRTAVIRLLVGGGMFALPIVYEAMYNLITSGGDSKFDNGIFSPVDFFSGLLGRLAGVLDLGATRDLNAVLSAIIISLKSLPGFITALAYMLGLLMGFQGLLKLKDHVENPDQNPLKEAVIRFVIGGMMFAIPTVYAAMALAFADGDDNTGLMGMISGFLSAFSLLESGYDTRGCTGDAIGALVDGTTGGITQLGGKSLGSALCGIIAHAGAIPSFLNALAYLFGLILGFWGLLKIRDHVLNPQNAPLSQGLSRLAAGGAFFTLPIILETIRATVTPAASLGEKIANTFGAGGPVSGYNDSGIDCENGGFLNNFTDMFTNGVQGAVNGIINIFTGGGGGDAANAEVSADSLDGRLYCAVSDILGPMHSILNFFTLIAGTIFIMIGISRLLKSEQDGARGPSGIGTFMTFIMGGVLLSYSEFVRLISLTIFSSGTSATTANIAYSASAVEMAHAHLFISAIIKFLIMVGLISFARGLFIIRGVAEGDNQSSLMAGMTHIIGGALAVNIGPLMNAVQATLGITEFGIVFS